MGRTEVNRLLAQGVLYLSHISHRGAVVSTGAAAHLVREDAGGQTRDDLATLELMRALQNVLVDEKVVPQEGSLVFHVAEQSADEGSNCERLEHPRVTEGAIASR